MNASLNPSPQYPGSAQQVPNFTGDDGTRKFLGQSPLTRCCCCFDVSLNTGCKILAGLQLIYGILGVFCFLLILGALDGASFLISVLWMSNFLAGYYGLQACSTLKADYARRFYYFNLYMFLVGVGLLLLSMIVSCSTASEYYCDVATNQFFGFAFVQAPINLYFLWVLFSFYARLDMGQMELVLYGPAYQHLAARNAMVTAQNSVANPQIAQGVQLHAVTITNQANMQNQLQNPVQGQFQNPVQGQFQNPMQGQFQNPVHGQFQNPMQGQFQNPVQGQSQSNPTNNQGGSSFPTNDTPQ